jgi:PAS domain S-box-containing protein
MKHHAIVVADQYGVIRLWSEAAGELTGYSRDETIGRKLDLVVPPQFRGSIGTASARR